MNKSAIKNFAVTARIKLMDAIEQKAYELGITIKEIKEPEVYKDGFRVNDKFFKKYQIKQRDKLIQKIRELGFEQVIEEVAYTWFNRFIAIRFMEVNEYLPTGVRVLSSIDSGKVEPDAVSDVLNIADELELDLDIVYRLQDENNTEELFKYILVKQCNKLGEIMPMMFEQIEDNTELLLPDRLLTEGSFVRDLVIMIAEEDWKEQVEIIGWLYQYYISEKKDQVFADLKKNKKISKENIPAATQLFTPKWIVQYMVENSLGRLWLESHPNQELQEEWKYFLKEAEQNQDIVIQLDKIKNKEVSPEEIRIIDPCMGSGHILVYAFDVLYKIYQSAGYAERDIPQLILEKNIYGLDIDDRAAQLAYFALMMKARSYNRRIFRKKIELNVCSIHDSKGISKEFLNSILSYNGSDNVQSKDLEYLIEVFMEAKEYGSLLNVEEIDFGKIENILNGIKKLDVGDLFTDYYREILLEKIPYLIKQAKIMNAKYDVLVTNPPYMNLKGMNENLKKYLKKNYPKTSGDLFAAFMEKGFSQIKYGGFNTLITMQSWMFLSSFQDFRKELIESKQLTSLMHLGNQVMGIAFGTSATVFRNVSLPKYEGLYFNITLDDLNGNDEIATLPIETKDVYKNSLDSFRSIPEFPITYWASDIVKSKFRENPLLKTFAKACKGMDTGNNDIFIRLWHEVKYSDIGFNLEKEEIMQTDKKYFPYNKGGGYRKWFGNLSYVIYWENEGKMIKEYPKSNIRNEEYYFKEGISWTYLSNSNQFGVRFIPKGVIFDANGMTMFTREDRFYLLMGLLNSKVAHFFLKIMNATIAFLIGDLNRIPIIFNTDEYIIEICKENVEISKEDWDSFETSWGYKKHPLLRTKNQLIVDAYNLWDNYCRNRFEVIKRNEIEINSYFINSYGLTEVIEPDVDDRDIKVSLSDKEREIKSFISYAVGCMFGRYSLDEEGLIFAGGKIDESKYRTYGINKDNIIPITDDEYFEDDVLNRLINFIRIIFGPEKLEENLDFIADTLTKKSNETTRQRIRRYFVKEFYKDHLQIYQKRPIYWLFESGKNDGFKALIYMHRYDLGTVAKIRTDYLHTLQRKYEAEMSRLDLLLESDVSTQEKTKAKKQKEKLQIQILECQQYDQVIAHVAQQKIEIDLDNGVKVNYEKFQNIEVPQSEGKKALKANLLAKI